MEKLLIHFRKKALHVYMLITNITEFVRNNFVEDTKDLMNCYKYYLLRIERKTL